MIDAAVILLFAYDRLPWAGLLVILGRDLVLLAGSGLLAPRGLEIDVNLVGKTATWVLYAAIFFRIVTHPATQWPLRSVLGWNRARPGGRRVSTSRRPRELRR